MDIFSQEDFWDEYGVTQDYQERFGIISRLLADTQQSILDIGCGDGAVLRKLSVSRPNSYMVGLDTFLNTKVSKQMNYCQATLPKLPFQEKSFDTVLLLEVLEHVMNMESSIQEIQRIAGNQIIIGVPYLENLETLKTICKNCKRITHAYGHLRKFSKNVMVNLLPDFQIKELTLAGIKQRRESKLGVFLEHFFARSYYQSDKFVCPFCGSHQSAERQTPFAVYQIIHRANKLLSFFSPELPYWVIASYERKRKL